jgi:hypothetical protein
VPLLADQLQCFLLAAMEREQRRQRGDFFAEDRTGAPP